MEKAKIVFVQSVAWLPVIVTSYNLNENRILNRSTLCAYILQILRAAQLMDIEVTMIMIAF